MTQQYDNELKGVLFKNKDKEQGDKKPDYTGSAKLDGVDYFMDAWINASDSGRKYMSVKFKAKNKQANSQPQQQQPKRQQQQPDDDAPW